MASAKPREGLIEKVKAEVQRLKFLGEQKQVLLSFGCDPYCSIEKSQKHTSKILKILLENGFPVAILTKGGKRCLDDIDLFIKYKDKIKVGATLTFTNDKHRQHYEPNAAPIQERLDTLKELKRKGIRTYVSLEPVIDVKQSLGIIEKTHKYVDGY